jgi:hypothetical protein
MKSIARSIQTEVPDEKVLSIYLDVDQSNTANRNRGFETALRDGLRELKSRLTEPSDVDAFQQCAQHVLRSVSEQRPGSGTMVIFARTGLPVTIEQYPVAMETAFRWDADPFIQPTLAAQDEFKPFLIILTDHQHARFLTSVLGQITERLSFDNPYPSKHTKTSGKNRIKSQTVFNRKSDERETKFLKEVAETASALFKSHSIKRIVLAGNEETSGQILRLLPTELRFRVASLLTLSMKAGIAEIREAAMKTATDAERQSEMAKVETLLQSAGTHTKVVVGIQETLNALKAGEVREFVYPRGILISGSRCENCDSVLVSAGNCPTCGGTLNPIKDIVEYAITAALLSGASVEQVRGEAAEKLSAAGGFGGFLRY